MEAAYWGAESFSDLDGSWSPSSSVSQISDQENHRPQQQQHQQQEQQQQRPPPQQQTMEYSGTDANQNIMDISGALSEAYGIFCDLEQGRGEHSPDSEESADSDDRLKSPTNSSASSNSGKKPKNPIKRLHQRNAANMRERRRMKTINDAFEGLRERIPLASGERKLSKVDTLRLAIRYIQHLSEMVHTCDSVGSMAQGQQEAAKVIIRYPMNTGYPGYCDDPYSADQYQLYGHSLSWQQHKPIGMAVDNKLTAKVWTPDVASQQDLDDMQSYVS
ncbi:hypothetical protein LSH36_901g00026 [Paralvinella palmiformis]|uniref:BHLH domain-containing protein n=1 Tax=Paralvinella palmiformis TaxID=53620 RepID=A0AAD9IZC3_9ANNE|nr:hypothetical protein LSH36_901g00026 [Paralvinella palmiformis]